MHPTVRGTFPRVIDSTMRADFVSCETKGYYSFNRKLGPPGGSVHLVAGGAYAKGLEVTRKLFYGPQKMPMIEAAEQGMLASMEAYGAFEVPEGKEQKGPDRVMGAIGSYLEKWPLATDHIQPLMLNGEPSVEFTFAIPIEVKHPETGEPLLYGGRCDMVGVYNDQIFPVDDKTTTQLGPTWPQQWNLRGQLTGYVWACQRFGRPAVGSIIRGTSFLKNSFGHSEAIQMRPQWMVDQWYEQLIHDTVRWVRAWEDGWFDQDFNETCSAYGGCPFQRLCTSAEPENWIEGYYEPRDWDPLAKVPYEQKQEVEVIEAPEALKALVREVS